MKLQQVSESCYAVLDERDRVCDANSGLVNRGGGVVIDTQPDLEHARRMIEQCAKVWHGPPKYVVNTSESGNHVSGNQLFAGAELIAHRSVQERMAQAANPRRFRPLLAGAEGLASPLMLRLFRPGALAGGRQLARDYDFAGIELTPPTTLFDERYVLHLGDLDVHLIHVGPCRGSGDTIVHVPREGVVFAGDAIARRCTPMGWTGSSERWLRCLDLIVWLDPDAIVPGQGGVCGVEGAMEMKAYLEYVVEESRRCFDQGLDAVEAAKRIELGPYAEWRFPARLAANVASAYREFRNEEADTMRGEAVDFEAMYDVAKARGLDVEF